MVEIRAGGEKGGVRVEGHGRVRAILNRGCQPGRNRLRRWHLSKIGGGKGVLHVAACGGKHFGWVEQMVPEP